MRFQGKTAIVTGGSTGIGLAAVRRFAAEGAAVYFAGRREQAGNEAEAQLRKDGLDVTFRQADVTDPAAIAALADAVAGSRGRIDILVNNAAVFYPISFLDGDPADWRKVFDTIVNGVYHCSRTVAKKMVESGGGGKIVNVSSINAYRALEQSSHYNAAKGALDQLTRGMAVELAEHGIAVNGVNPGFVDTPMSVVDGVPEHETDWFRDIYVKRKKIPLQRTGRPEEVAAVVAFLASDDASYLCGVTVPVDGGLSITF